MIDPTWAYEGVAGAMSEIRGSAAKTSLRASMPP